jgi:hypothetical protein
MINLEKERIEKIKNNPYYKNGLYWGRKMGNIIERTNYKTLDNAINIKNELVKDLKENFGWEDTYKDVAENLGIIVSLIEMKNEKLKSLSEKEISENKIKIIASNLGYTLNEDEIAEVKKAFYINVKTSEILDLDYILEQTINTLKNDN